MYMYVCILYDRFVRAGFSDAAAELMIKIDENAQQDPVIICLSEQRVRDIELIFFLYVTYQTRHWLQKPHGPLVHI